MHIISLNKDMINKTILLINANVETYYELMIYPEIYAKAHL